MKKGSALMAGSDVSKSVISLASFSEMTPEIGVTQMSIIIKIIVSIVVFFGIPTGMVEEAMKKELICYKRATAVI